jgi:hypothetical protein
VTTPGKIMRRLAVVLVLLACDGARAPTVAPERPAPRTQGAAAVPGPPSGLHPHTHPRLLLDAASLTRLTIAARGDTPAWTALAAVCDAQPDLADSLGALASLGLCYQIEHALGSTRAAEHGQKGVRLLEQLARREPFPHGAAPDDGVGLALGYDWLYTAMPQATRASVADALVRRVETARRDYPFVLSLAFVGRYAGQGLSALALEGDHPHATALWQDWLTHLHRGQLLPQVATDLADGGWPDGWPAGYRASLDIVLPIVAARTAKGLDLVTDPVAPFTLPSNQATYLIHATAPSLRTLSDRGAQDGPDPGAASVDGTTELAGLLAMLDAPTAPLFHSYARAVRRARGGAAKPWIELLFWDDKAAERDYRAQRLLRVARGMDEAAFRSSWQQGAVWGVFAGGPYIGDPEGGGQYFDAGGLTIGSGDRPVLVNTEAELVRGAGPDDDTRARLERDDLFGRDGHRSIFNTFYLARPLPYGQIAVSRAMGATTRIDRSEEGDSYARVRAVDLADVYPTEHGRRRLRSFKRDVLFLRPHVFVVIDRTQPVEPRDDQWMAWHLAGRPQRAMGEGPHRMDIQAADGRSLGTITTVLPRDADERIVDVLGKGKVYRLEVRARSPLSPQIWLTVFDLAQDAQHRASIVPLSRSALEDRGVEGDRAHGVQIDDGQHRWTLVAYRTALDAVASYMYLRPPKLESEYLILDAAQLGGYRVRRVGDGVEIGADGPYIASTGGVLHFFVKDDKVGE